MADRTTQRGRLLQEYLDGQRVRLRPIAREDLPALHAWDEDPEIVALMGRKFQGFDESPQDWYRRMLTSRRTRALGIEVNERLIGEIELDHIDWRTGAGELRLLIGEKKYWGQGYGGDAVRTLLRLAFGPWGLQTVYLRVYQDNQRAIRLYERCGFSPQGILGPSSRRDDRGPVLLMGITRMRFIRLLRESGSDSA